MSRATPDLTQGFTGVSLPKTGPRQMGTDADGRTSVITFLNQVTESMASLHDNQTSERPDYLPINGIWCYTDPDGTKTVYQYDGETDVPLWSLSAAGIMTLGDATHLPQTSAPAAEEDIATMGYVDGAAASAAAGKLDASVYAVDAPLRVKAWARVNSDGTIYYASPGIISCSRTDIGRYTYTLMTGLLTKTGCSITSHNVSSSFGMITSISTNQIYVRMMQYTSADFDTSHTLVIYGG
jgi:hypothetical protein